MASNKNRPRIISVGTSLNLKSHGRIVARVDRIDDDQFAVVVPGLAPHAICIESTMRDAMDSARAFASFAV